MEDEWNKVEQHFVSTGLLAKKPSSLYHWMWCILSALCEEDKQERQKLQLPSEMHHSLIKLHLLHQLMPKFVEALERAFEPSPGASVEPRQRLLHHSLDLGKTLAFATSEATELSTWIQNVVLGLAKELNDPGDDNT